MREKKKGLIQLLGVIAVELFLIALAVWFLILFFNIMSLFRDGRQCSMTGTIKCPEA